MPCLALVAAHNDVYDLLQPVSFNDPMPERILNPLNEKQCKQPTSLHLIIPTIQKKASLLRLAREFFSYVLVGGLAFVADFYTIKLFLNLSTHYLLATCAGFLVGLITNYLLCILWVWRGTRATTLKDIAVFALIGVGGLVITLVLMWASVDWIGWPVLPSKIVITGLVLAWNFGLRKVFVFFR